MARKAAVAIEDAKYCTETLAEIAGMQRAAGARDAAQRTLVDALRSAATISFAGDRARAFAEIARAQTASGEYRTARDALAGALTAPENRGTRTPLESPILRAADDRHGPAQMIAALSIGDAKARAQKLADISKGQAAAGEDTAAVMTLIREASAAIKGWQRDETLRDIAFGQLYAGQHQMACEIAAMIDDKRERAEMLTYLAEEQVAAGEREASKKALIGALEAAGAIESNSARAESLSEIAHAQAAAGEQAAANKTLADAVVAAAAIKEDEHYARADTLQAIARAQAAVGQPEKARESAAAIEGRRERAKAHEAAVNHAAKQVG